MRIDPDVLAVITDTRLTPEARSVVLYVAARGAGTHEISHREFARLLHNRGEKALRAAIQDAADLWLRRTPGGRGHHDRYEFRVAHRDNLTDSPAPTATLSADRVAPGAHLNSTSSSLPTTDPSPSPSPSARAREGPADTDLARLRAYLGGHARAVDLMLGSAEHTPSWVAAVLGKYAKGGTQEGVFGGIAQERRPAVLADAITEYATEGKPYANRLFDGYVRKAADAERRSANRGRDPGGSPAAPGVPRSATGTDGGRRSGFIIE